MKWNRCNIYIIIIGTVQYTSAILYYLRPAHYQENLIMLPLYSFLLKMCILKHYIENVTDSTRLFLQKDYPLCVSEWRIMSEFASLIMSSHVAPPSCKHQLHTASCAYLASSLFCNSDAYTPTKSW